MTPGTYQRHVSIGSILVMKGKITEAELKKAVAEQNRLINGDKPLLGAILVQMGVCSDADVKTAMEYQDAVTLADDDGRLRAAKHKLSRALAVFETTLEDTVREITRDVEIPQHG